MDIETFRNHCIIKPGVTEEFPFGADALVFKVMGKMFSVTSLSAIPFTVNLKCDPERAIELRERYDDIIPGFHMNKKHWNTVTMESGLNNKLLYELIDHSYNLVVSGLSKKLKSELSSL